MAKSGTQPVTGDPMKLVCLAVIAVILLVAPTYSQDVMLSPAMTAEVYEPVAISHSDSEELIITHLDTGDRCPPKRIKRIGGMSVFVPVVGRYLIQAGDRFGLVIVNDEAVEVAEPEPIEPPDAVAEAKPIIQVWAYMGENCQPCEAWKRNELAKLEARSDVKVWLVAPGQHDKEFTPTFIVSGNGRALEAKGYASGQVNTADKLLNLVNGIAAR